MSRCSIVMGTYNGVTYLEEQLSTIMSQRNLAFEMVICDDQSTDGTHDLIESITARMRMKVRIVRNDRRLGFKANFMKAAALCEGDIVAFCDQDDVWAPDKLMVMTRCFENNNVVLAYHNSFIIDNKGNRLGVFWKEGRFQELSDPAIPPLLTTPPEFCMLFRRELLRYSDLRLLSIDPYNNEEPMAHDSWIFFLAGALGEVILIKEPLASYRQHQANVYGHRRSSLYSRGIAYLRKLAGRGSGDRERSLGWFEAQAVALYNRIDLLHMIRQRVPQCDEARFYRYLARHVALGDVLTKRCWMYAEPRWSRRARLFWSILKQGGYASRKSSLGRHAALKDILMLLPFGWDL